MNVSPVQVVLPQYSQLVHVTSESKSVLRKSFIQDPFPRRNNFSKYVELRRICTGSENPFSLDAESLPAILMQKLR